MALLEIKPETKLKKRLTQALALGNYRQDLAYTAALKSTQALALGNYRQDLSYTAALKSSSPATSIQGIIPVFEVSNPFQCTGVEHCLAPVIFWESWGLTRERLGYVGI